MWSSNYQSSNQLICVGCNFVMIMFYQTPFVIENVICRSQAISFFFLGNFSQMWINIYRTRCLLHYSSAYSLHLKLLCILQESRLLLTIHYICPEPSGFVCYAYTYIYLWLFLFVNSHCAEIQWQSRQCSYANSSNWPRLRFWSNNCAA